MTIIKAKAALDVDYCASKQIFDDIENSEDYFDVDDLFAIFAISRKWATKKELELAKISIASSGTAEMVVELEKLSSVIEALNGSFVKSFAKMLNQRKDDVVSRVRTWLCVYVRFVEELLLLEEFFELCIKQKERGETQSNGGKGNIRVCEKFWKCYFATEARLALLQNKL